MDYYKKEFIHWLEMQVKICDMLIGNNVHQSHINIHKSYKRYFNMKLRELGVEIDDRK